MGGIKGLRMPEPPQRQNLRMPEPSRAGSAAAGARHNLSSISTTFSLFNIRYPIRSLLMPGFS